ncbi:NADH dehydrogenase [ubiquinone] 1 alpha subcomplex subunit 8 [Chrysoperla carnea]|uniref:NADH dehydrogenase [ubiquinone] 1 alpha subcomplex subunit 8 n=1 Tax=Chrysoperla carnea TaxID=189513 RepID=UPI001D092749|nr:NADH dehydrogenase [ubiquinone] 1 alpha subcomplex subunit 8 [Chrysoperla carnea]
MVLTDHVSLPSDEQLTVTEINLSTSALRAGAFHVGKVCEHENNEFVLCRQELDDPRGCLAEGKVVTNCALNFFRNVKRTCADEFTQYANCLDKSSGNFDFTRCRKTQAVYDKCVKDNLNIDRPEYGYFCRPKIHKTNRKKPEEEPIAVYPDATPGLPDDYPRYPAKYGSRFHTIN